MTRLLYSCRHIVAIALLLAAGPATAAEFSGPPAVQHVATPYTFDQLVDRLKQTIAANNMGLVSMASASRGAAARGVKIPGNAVLMIFRNDYAVRMLKASVAAGIEAPLRLYVTENADGTTAISYAEPSAVFAPYGSAQLDQMARELDAVFDTIVTSAAAP